MTALSFVWVHPYSQNSRCDTINGFGQSVSLGVGRALSSRTIHQNMHEEQGNI